MLALKMIKNTYSCSIRLTSSLLSIPAQTRTTLNDRCREAWSRSEAKLRALPHHFCSVISLLQEGERKVLTRLLRNRNLSAVPPGCFPLCRSMAGPPCASCPECQNDARIIIKFACTWIYVLVVLQYNTVAPVAGISPSLLATSDTTVLFVAQNETLALRLQDDFRTTHCSSAFRFSQLLILY